MRLRSCACASMCATAAVVLAVPAARAEGTGGKSAAPPSSSVAPDKPDTGAAFVAGAAAVVLGFVVGGLVIATSNDGAAQNNAGWLTMESGFALAPLASHAVTGEWGRGLVFAAPPLAAIAGTSTLFAVDPEAVVHGTLPQQRVLWSFFVVGLLSASAGVVDASLAGYRRHVPRVAVAPAFGPGHAGLDVEGAW